jgi:DNA-binding CsgD family transcriptional regulator
MLHTSTLRDDILSAALDLLVVGIVLVDGECRVVHANRAAVRWLEEAQAVRRVHGRLTANDPAAALALRVAVAQAARSGHQRSVKTGIETPIPDADGRDLAAWVLPLSAGLADKLDAPRAAQVAVFLREIGDTAQLPGELLARHYGITPAECRVLMFLVKGMSPNETAGALGCSETTVRTHLQHLFAKTGTRGQPDLIRLAMSALAPASM